MQNCLEELKKLVVMAGHIMKYVLPSNPIITLVKIYFD
ncbi:hypothetical protein RINTHM_360 [Richelia intracellularis HM01]|nr:hypothetical protein RINTHM_360 [Richelia intracellularis HM01]